MRKEGSGEQDIMTNGKPDISDSKAKMEHVVRIGEGNTSFRVLMSCPSGRRPICGQFKLQCSGLEKRKLCGCGEGWLSQSCALKPGVVSDIGG